MSKYDSLKVKIMQIRQIPASAVSDAVRELFISACRELPGDVASALDAAAGRETSGVGKAVMSAICENFRLAAETSVPICQDTGMAIVFAELGSEAVIAGATLSEAVNDGVRRAYGDGYLRKSVVADPLKRVNTGDNTPCVLHIDSVGGSGLKLTAFPKGFGSENMSALKMFTPSASAEDIIRFAADTVIAAGGNPCPPVFIGVGLGGAAETACLLAKKALLREGENADPFYAGMERRILELVNASGIGPAGLGGEVTAVRAAIMTAPTHIAGLPAAVNICCHACRHKSVTL